MDQDSIAKSCAVFEYSKIAYRNSMTESDRARRAPTDDLFDRAYARFLFWSDQHTAAHEAYFKLVK